ncbi:MAG: YlbF family regulator [Clostridia bacterium]|nr:YlbF family regulator [Clostridia bacterium]
MKVYDKANELARDLKECNEYIAYKKIKDEVYEKPELVDKIKEFDKIKYDAQVLAIHGEKQDEEKIKKLQELYEILLKEPKVKEYFDAEMRFNVLLADVNKIIGEAVKDVLK